MSNQNVNACSCSSASVVRSSAVQLPVVLINQILTYIAEINGNAWMYLINPDTGGRRKRVNPFSRFIQPVYKSVAHRSCNYPANITVGINGLFVEGTIKCMSWEMERAQKITGEECVFFNSQEMIEYEVGGFPEYVILKGVYFDNQPFYLYESFQYCPDETVMFQCNKIKTAEFQDRDIIIMETENDDDDNMEWLDEDYNGLGWNHDEDW